MPDPQRCSTSLIDSTPIPRRPSIYSPSRMTLGVDDLRAAAADGSIDTVVVAFTDHYGRLLGKRFDLGFFLDSIDDGTHVCDYLLTIDMEMEPVPGYAFASWEQGYGDVHLVPDLATLRLAAWTDHTAIVLCDVVDDRPVATSTPASRSRRERSSAARSSDSPNSGWSRRRRRNWSSSSSTTRTARRTNGATRVCGRPVRTSRTTTCSPRAESSPTCERPGERSAPPASRSRTRRASGGAANTS